FQDGAFDYAVLGEVIEHLENPQGAIDEAMRILKKGGTLAISTPLEEAIEPGAVDAHRHLWSFSENDLKQMLSKHGEVKFSVVGSQFFPTYKYRWKTLFAFVTKK
ncbi:MAG: methyltransferase domain-containing protein, partial [Minisyncoccia bacterium]